MVDQNKIIMMTKLAAYEKKYMWKDKRKLDFFIEDYIYMRNFMARFGITVIFLFSVAVGGFKTFTNEIIFPASVTEFLSIYVQPYFWPWIIGIIVYTLISTIISTIEYKKASDRFGEYKRILKELGEYESQQGRSKGVSDEI